jgi:hypothetical protein
VTITETSDPTLANVVLDTSTTSASGGAADGVLGCYDGAAGEITVIHGWNWYAGADPAAIRAGQYDLETTVLHELGHALGLGHSADPSSPMHGTLAPGVADRTVTTDDLNIPDPPQGADPQIAAGFHFGTPAVATPQTAFVPAIAQGANGTSLWSVVGGPLMVAQRSLASGQWSVVSGQTSAGGGAQASVVFQDLDHESALELVPSVRMESTEFRRALNSATQDGAAAGHGQPAGDTPTGPARPALLEFDGMEGEEDPFRTPGARSLRGYRATDSALDDLVSEPAMLRGRNAAWVFAGPRASGYIAAVTDAGNNIRQPESGQAGWNSASADLTSSRERDSQSAPFAARLAAIVLATGWCGRMVTKSTRAPIGNKRLVLPGAQLNA